MLAVGRRADRYVGDTVGLIDRVVVGSDWDGPTVQLLPVWHGALHRNGQ
ncbi:hypothetical protein ACFQH8_02295 [Halomicroarcula sp. GCM10025710]